MPQDANPQDPARISSEATQVLAVSDVMSLVRVEAVSLSPGNDEVLFCKTSPRPIGSGPGNRIASLWRQDVQNDAAVQIAGEAQAPGHSPCGQFRSWLANDVNGRAQVMWQDRSSGRISALTSHPLGVRRYGWSPSGAVLAFIAPEPETADETLAMAEGRDAVVVSAPARQLQLHVVDCGSGIARAVSAPGQSVHEFGWSPDETRLIAVVAPSPDEDDRLLYAHIAVITVAGGRQTPVAPPPRSRLSEPRWSPDGQWLSWRGGIGPTDIADANVFVAPANGGAPRDLWRNGPASVVGADWLPVKPARLVLRLIDRQSTRLVLLDPATGAQEQLALAGPQTEPLVMTQLAPSRANAAAFSADGSGMAVVACTALHPNEIFHGVPGAALHRITRHNPGLGAQPMNRPETLRWMAPDGLEIEGVLMRPVGFQTGRRYPVVLHIHGGSEDACQMGWLGDYPEDNLIRLLAAQGYMVLCPNYRGSLGRGASFAMGEHDDVMGQSFDDILAGLDHLTALGLADPDRAGIIGYSWGGMAAALGATRNSTRFRVAVCGGVMANWLTHSGTSRTRMHDQVAHWNRVAWEGNQALFLNRSAVTHAHRDATPLLILHGENDIDAPTAQAWELYSALRWKGAEVAFVLYPREGHVFTEEAHQRDYLERSLAWIARHLPADPPQCGPA